MNSHNKNYKKAMCNEIYTSRYGALRISQSTTPHKLVGDRYIDAVLAYSR